MHRADLTKLAPLSEAHYSDLYGNAIKRFHEKYKNADGHTYYANFNPVAGDPRDKTIVGLQSDSRTKAERRYHSGEISLKDFQSPLYKSPSDAHGDPVGTYGYPVDYVANHWYDVDYGRDMRYLRVLKALVTPDQTLRLNNMSREYFLEVMKRLNLEFNVKGDGQYATRNPNDAMMIYEAIFEEDASSIAHFRINSYGKVIFRLIQNDFTFEVNHVEEDDEEEDEDEFGEDPNRDVEFSDRGSFKYEGYLKVTSEKPRSAQKQNERARKAGFSLILDRAKSPMESTIHPNEPEQAIFLTNRAYEVVEVFDMPSLPDESGKTKVDERGVTKMIQKVAGQVASTIGDRLAEPASVGGRFPIKNLAKFRYWLWTEEIKNIPTTSSDPTITQGRIEAWITAKGRLIVITPNEGRNGDVENAGAMEENEDAIQKARIRPGENRSSIITNLRSYHQESLEKPHHRAKLDHNTLTFTVGVVGEWSIPIFTESGYQDGVDAISRDIERRAAGAGKMASKRITQATLKDYQKALARHQSGYTDKVMQTIKQSSGPAAGAPPSAQPSATPPATDESSARQEP